METVSPQKVNFAINYLNILPFPFAFVTSLQDLGGILRQENVTCSAE
jgi:hypothetical protein